MTAIATTKQLQKDGSDGVCLPVEDMQEMQVQSLGWEDPLEEGVATHSSILSRRIPRTEKADRLQYTGLQKVKYDKQQSTHALRP